MSNRNDLWSLLIQRVDQWVTRDDLNFVGGEDAGRRMREIREDIVRSGKYRLEERKDPKGRLEFRLALIADTPVQSLRYLWRCRKCDSHPTDFSQTQPSIDPRWRLGRCDICRDKNATFQQVKS